MSRLPANRQMPKPPRWDADEWESATFTVLVRDGDRCLWCGQLLRNDVARHHRMRRREGGDRLANIVLLHRHCHEFVHGHSIEARSRGFIVSIYLDVLTKPLIDYLLRAWLLDDIGGRLATVAIPEG